MTRLLAKARAALLTDPVTRAPLPPQDVISLVIGLWTAFGVILAMLVLGLGLGGGQ